VTKVHSSSSTRGRGTLTQDKGSEGEEVGGTKFRDLPGKKEVSEGTTPEEGKKVSRAKTGSVTGGKAIVDGGRGPKSAIPLSGSCWK